MQSKVITLRITDGKRPGAPHQYQRGKTACPSCKKKFKYLLAVEIVSLWDTLCPKCAGHNHSQDFDDVIIWDMPQYF